MNRKPTQRVLRRLGLVLSIVFTPVILLTAVLVSFHGNALASSHREAPLISKDPGADNTDTYAFVSPQNPNNLVLIGSWIPLEAPEGGPNYYEWDDTARYDLYVDNNGDAKPEITYTLSSRVEVEKPTDTFLYNIGPITGLSDANWNRKQFITVTETTAAGAVKTLVNNQLVAPVNIGEKSTPNYTQTLESAAIRTVTDGGDTIKIFAGQTDDPFWVDLQVFDLLTLRGHDAPLGYKDYNRPVDALAGFNVHSFVIEVPISRLKQGGSEPVLGIWSGTRRPATRVLLGPGGLGDQSTSGNYVQVSRLGMPLVNEAVIPMGLKDAFNSIPPSADLPLYQNILVPGVGPILQRSVENPELGVLLCKIYGIPVPHAVDATSSDLDKKCNVQFTTGTPRTGRRDIFDIFLTGFKLAKDFTIHAKSGDVVLKAGTNVNQPQNVVPAEMIRINTAIAGDPANCSPTPSRLGVLGGDACGFPNGRRLTDDVVEIELLAVAGAAYQVIDGQDASFTFNSQLAGVLTDNIDHNDKPFRSTFPYLAPAQSGQARWHDNPFFNLLLPAINKN